MLSIGAEFAYAAGYSGTGMNVGIVDSGVFAGHMREHGSLDTNYAIGDRFFSVVAQGGDTGPTPGFYDPAFNDSHGTHVSGTVGASRDGVGETTPAGPEANMHGVAFNSDVYLGNTHKTDGVFYGLLPPTATPAQTPDNAYLANVYRAVNAARTKNGKPIRIITSSWGSQPPTENYNTLEPPPGAPASFGLNAAWRYLSTPEGVADANGNTSHWLNGAIKAARTGTIVQFTAGNSGYANPTPRGAAPYYLPDLEGRYYTTSGINPGIGRTLNPDGSVLVPGQQEFNQCGVATWSCVTAPSRAINSTWVELVDGTPQPTYRSASGTSMAGPHSAAALSLVMKRFPYMTNEQALYTMFTTGRQNATINDASGAAVPNPTAARWCRFPTGATAGTRPTSGTPSRARASSSGPSRSTRTGTATCGRTTSPTSPSAHVSRRMPTRTPPGRRPRSRRDGPMACRPARATSTSRTSPSARAARRRARRASTRAASRSAAREPCSSPAMTRWHGESTVRAGKLSVVGSHAGSIDVDGGTLGGSGSVERSIDVDGGVLQPGLAPEEAERITDVPVEPGNVLNAGGDVSVGRKGRVAVTIRGDDDYTSVRAAGDLELDGELALDVHGALTRGHRAHDHERPVDHGPFPRAA